MADRFLRTIVGHDWTRRLLNSFYLRFSAASRTMFHVRFSKIFRAAETRASDGTWKIRFGGRTITMPIRARRSWLDWDQAVSILGHEPAIKETYATLLSSDAPPDLFIDIGANYGTHSLLFLSSGVETLTFEPNSSCHEFFREACGLNDVTPDLQATALGAATGHLELHYPERETWLGSTDARVIERLRATGQLEVQRVEVRRLDDYYERLRGRRALIKLDAEGHEVSILAGADRTLRDHRPVVLFEAHRGHQRGAVFAVFDERGYRLGRLPLRARRPVEVVSREEFLQTVADDFIAIPAERFGPGNMLESSDVFRAPPQRFETARPARR